MVWGFFGHDTIGQAVGAALSKHFEKGRVTDWADFGAVLGEMTATANGNAKRLAELAGTELPPHWGICTLAAGYVRREAGIVVVDQIGQPVHRNPVAFLASPIGFAAANAACTTLERERGDAFRLDADTLRMVMGVVTSIVNGAGGAIQLWQVTTKGPERLQ